MKRLELPYIVSNGFRCYLDLAELLQRQVKFTNGIEQCEGCGSHLDEAKLLSVAWLRCEVCKNIFEIQWKEVGVLDE